MTSIRAETEKRLQAIDPEHSFIVQAPAGSGKTELLTQRYLRLLSLANSPEEIVAITFTRKAAAEMRERVLHTLTHAKAELTSEHQILTQSLALEVLSRDQQRQWHLLKTPSRLRILTIDALCTQLSNQMPLLSRLSPSARINEDAQPLYKKAVIAFLKNLEHNSESSWALKELLLAIDNRAETLVELLIAILARREQWLALLMFHYQDPDSLRTQLELSLEEVIKETLFRLDQQFPSKLKDDLFLLVQLAATHLTNTNEEHPLCQWLDLSQFPKADLNNHKHWEALAKLLLTEEQNWRKVFDKRQGFPSESKDKHIKENFKKIKEKMKNLVRELAEDNLTHALLCDLINAPARKYTEEQWVLLKCLIYLLPRLVAELNFVFQNENCIDFVELSLSALRALGTPDNPTDLALYLDCQIKHLLIDEFQDTSLIQFKLIEQLTAQWQPDEHKSLFLVGDPMQSIYRFRNAEVGLFLRVQQQGIGQIKLTTINLSYNFRSDPRIIDWINQCFATTFPKISDISSGSVPYATSIASKRPQPSSGVFYYPLFDSTAEQVLDIVQSYRANDPKARVAILVRARSQLQEIIPSLQKAGIKFKAVELEELGSRIEIEDLFSLTRALNHFSDRNAWLSILRAPWCGLKLADLHKIALHADKKPLWASLIRFKEITGLSDDALKRLENFVPALERSLQLKGRYSQADWIKSCWLELKGPACLDELSQLNNTEHYFELIRSLSRAKAFSMEELERKLAELYAAPNTEADESLQLMTIHKAKGLEFDHVILPHLESVSLNEKTQLLRWLERPRLTQASDLILAPFKASGVENEAIYDYLLRIEKCKLEHEMLRLFYVATSRTKLSLHLIFELELDNEKKPKTPSKRSFLNYLWPQWANEFEVEKILSAKSEPNFSQNSQTQIRLLKRLALDS